MTNLQTIAEKMIGGLAAGEVINFPAESEKHYTVIEKLKNIPNLNLVYWIDNGQAFAKLEGLI